MCEKLIAFINKELPEWDEGAQVAYCELIEHIEEGLFDPSPVQPDTDTSQKDAEEMANMLSTMQAQMETTNHNLKQMVKRLEVIQ